MGVDCSSEGEDDWRKGERIRQQKQVNVPSSWFYNEKRGKITFQKSGSQVPRKTFLGKRFFFFKKHLLISNGSEKEFMTTCFLNKYSKKREGGCLKSRSLANFVKGREH